VGGVPEMPEIGQILVSSDWWLVNRRPSYRDSQA
jgi:hypothetical protein